MEEVDELRIELPKEKPITRTWQFWVVIVLLMIIITIITFSL